jgi:hypothetical protein
VSRRIPSYVVSLGVRVSRFYRRATGKVTVTLRDHVVMSLIHQIGLVHRVPA